ncbi:MAG: hypothetical protein DIU63_06590 [Proteobacteria bacterium]|jgi:hypothetical protein|nr:MAG: hypothetical protein DIU63_06590 [Pseudomonadota bacterium]
MSSGRIIDYEALAQDAMRGVVRTVLARTAKSGLPGDHHFYISFDTQHPGVVLSKRLREKYPEEMTIVLQHRFWDLNVTEDRFEVKLTFDGIPERLVVPFAAVKIFFDPSVRYGLQFESPDFSSETSETAEHAQTSGDEEIVSERPQPSPLRATARASAERKLTPRAPRKTRAERTAETTESQESAAQAPAASPATSETSPRETSDEPTPPKPHQGAEIVRLDAFRKK